MKKITVLILITILALCVAACRRSSNGDTQPTGAATESGSVGDPIAANGGSNGGSQGDEAGRWPSYLNLDSVYPVINWGEGDDIVITAVSVDLDTGYEWENYWLAQYIANFMNINMEMERIMISALAERKNLMFAADDLPDLLLTMYLSPEEMVRYGSMEKQLMPIERFIDDELTPDLKYWLDFFDNVYPLITAPDGHIYSVPQLDDGTNIPGLTRISVNVGYLGQRGLDLPETLDQLISHMRTLKESPPEGHASGSFYPIIGSFQGTYSIGPYILNALGYVGAGSDTGISPGVRNGQMEFPLDNLEVFTEYLTIMKTLFEEELVPPDFIQMDSNAAVAYLMNGQGVVFPDSIIIVEDMENWRASYPLTSDYNSQRVWTDLQSVYIGGFAISSKAQFPEVCMNFINAYYSYDAVKLWTLPPYGSEEAMGFNGPYWDDEAKAQAYDESKFPPDAPDLWNYLIRYVSYYPTFGCFGPEARNHYQMTLLGGDPVPLEISYDTSTPDGIYSNSVLTNLMPYRSESFPAINWLSEEVTIRLSDLAAVITPYASEQTALFVSGLRPLDQVSDFLDEMARIGFDEYRAIHQDIWDSYVANK